MQQLMDELNNDPGLREKYKRELAEDKIEQVAFRQGLTTAERRRRRSKAKHQHNLAIQDGVRRALGRRTA